MKYEIEQLLNIIIPEQIKRIIESQEQFKILIDGHYESFKSISINELLAVYKEQENLFDYDIIPFAFLDDDFLCLYYKKDIISIIYWSSERALESKSMAIFEIYYSYEDFLHDMQRN